MVECVRDSQVVVDTREFASKTASAENYSTNTNQTVEEYLRSIHTEALFCSINYHIGN